MSKQIRLTYCGMDGTGRTVTEAKAEAARRLTALVSDLRRHSPTIVEFRGIANLVYRDAEGWCTMQIEGGSSTLGYADRDEALRAAAFRVADLAWSHDVSADIAFATEALQRYVPARELNSLARDLASRWAWQRRYKAARDEGYSDNAALHIAGGLGHLVESGKIR